MFIKGGIMAKVFNAIGFLFIVSIFLFLYGPVSSEIFGVHMPTEKYYWYSIYTWSDLGNIYRFFTANFAHYDNQHLLGNTLALALVWFVFFYGELDNLIYKTLAIVVISFVVTSYVAFSGNYNVYAGFSGVIHGLIAMALVGRIIEIKEIKAWIGMGLLTAKIFVDYTLPNYTFAEFSQKLYGNAMSIKQFLGEHSPMTYKVCAESHLAGALAGVCMALLILVVFKKFMPTQYK